MEKTINLLFMLMLVTFTASMHGIKQPLGIVDASRIKTSHTKSKNKDERPPQPHLNNQQFITQYTQAFIEILKTGRSTLPSALENKLTQFEPLSEYEWEHLYILITRQTANTRYLYTAFSHLQQATAQLANGTIDPKLSNFLERGRIACIMDAIKKQPSSSRILQTKTV